MVDQDAVRNYLTALANPAALQDESKLNELEEAIASSDDVLERLKLRAQAKRLSDVSPEDYVQGFVENAKDWADSNDVPVSVLVDEGVDPDVLRRAGFDVAGPKAGKGSGKKRTRVTQGDVREAMKRFADPFTVSDLVDASGAADATVRKAIEKAKTAGEVEQLAPDTSGVGAPTNRYQVKDKSNESNS